MSALTYPQILGMSTSTFTLVRFVLSLVGIFAGLVETTMDANVKESHKWHVQRDAAGQCGKPPRHRRHGPPVDQLDQSGGRQTVCLTVNRVSIGFAPGRVVMITRTE
jgi:hypothetical protein